MDEYSLEVTEKCLSEVKTLLNSTQTVLANSLFDDDIFKATCRSVRDRNEARIFHSITPYIVPSAESLAIKGADGLKCLIENINEPWILSIPVTGPRPQPDYCVGFRRTAFTEEQLERLDPLIGTGFETSFFIATLLLYFPFLTCEVKRSGADLDVADRQNAHSMTIAVRGIVELFRAVNREKELNREILAFSVAHNHEVVKIYGHYAVIGESKTTFYRHAIKKFFFVTEEGLDKWTAYKFTKNIYDIWMPKHLKRICSAIEQLPADLDFGVLQEPTLQFDEAAGLSQEMDSLLSNEQQDNQPGPSDRLANTPDTSMSRAAGSGTAKRVRKNPTRE